MSSLRRARGAVLRLVRRPRLSAALGTILLVPGAWVEMTGRAATWWADGVALIAVATGAALVWTALTGVRPDWIDE